MAYTNRAGLIARFKTGYLQREIILPRAAVTGGADVSVLNSNNTGYIVGRIVKITKSSDDVGELFTVTSPTNVATPLADGTHIIAQSDSSLRNVPGDAIPTDKYISRYDDVLKNTAEYDYKSIAVYKIVNPDDIELVTL